MDAAEFFQRGVRRFELGVPSPFSFFRKVVFRARGAKIGRIRHFPACRMVWPHQVQIGNDCILQHGIFFNYDHYWTPGPSIVIGDRVFVANHVEFNIRARLEIDDDCLIAAGCFFVDHDHAIAPGAARSSAENECSPIRLGRNVWLGARCIVLKGVTIGDDAVVGAGSVVTKSIPPGEVWVGNPARAIHV